MMNLLKKIKDYTDDCCVTILLNTHRTRPDNERDPLVLKNLIKDVSTRLDVPEYRDSAALILENIKKVADSINHQHNLESLVIFANKNEAEMVRLPIKVVDRVVIATTYATRDIIRSLHHDKTYYILVAGKEKARLIHAYNDTVIEEFTDSFPLTNPLKPGGNAERADAIRQTNLELEFLNKVDKEIQKRTKDNPHRVLIYSSEALYNNYLKIVDRKEMVLGFQNSTESIDAKAEVIAKSVWNRVKEIRKKELDARIEELGKAEGAKKVISELTDIWKAVNEGRGKTLFVEKGYFQAAKINNNTVELIKDGQTVPGMVDDIIDDMIEINLKNGGDCVFLGNGELKKYQGIALTARY